MIVEMVGRGEPPDMVLLAAMPEQPRTRPLIPLFRDWMDAHGMPNEIVEYKVTRCKHWPPYNDLLEACLTNGTLPSIALWLDKPQHRIRNCLGRMQWAAFPASNVKSCLWTVFPDISRARRCVFLSHAMTDAGRKRCYAQPL